MAVTVREIERKYEVPGGTAPALTGVAGVADESTDAAVVLEAVYYDTDDLRLLGDGVTLRRRSGGEDAGWHLKLPAGRDTREEVRLPPGDDGDEVPAELADLVRARTRGRVLGPVVRMHTTRHRRRLLDAARRTLAEVATDQVTAQTLDRAVDDTSWQEIEVELVTGGRDVLHAIDARLRENGARPAAQANKLARVLGDRLPVRTEPRPPTAGTPVADVLMAYIAAQVKAIAAVDPKVRRDEPDAVHQLRVALRRTRSTFRTYGRLLDRERTRPLGEELRWLAGALAGMRDGEVMAGRLRAGVAELSAGTDLVPAAVPARIDAYFARTLAEARESALHQLNGRRYFTVLDALDDLLAAPPLTERAGRTAGDELPRVVGRAYRRLARAVDRIGAAPDAAAADEATHDARKAAKRARYAAEAAEAVLGKDARRLAGRMKRLQDVLGEHQDGVVARSVIRDIAAEAHAAGEDTFAYGLLYAREERRAGEIERDLPAAWRHADHGHPWATG